MIGNDCVSDHSADSISTFRFYFRIWIRFEPSSYDLRTLTYVVPALFIGMLQEGLLISKLAGGRLMVLLGVSL